MLQVLPRTFDRMCTIQIKLKRHIDHATDYMYETIRPGFICEALKYLKNTELYLKYKIQLNNNYVNHYENNFREEIDFVVDNNDLDDNDIEKNINNNNDAYNINIDDANDIDPASNNDSHRNIDNEHHIDLNSDSNIDLHNDNNINSDTDNNNSLDISIDNNDDSNINNDHNNKINIDFYSDNTTHNNNSDIDTNITIFSDIVNENNIEINSDDYNDDHENGINNNILLEMNDEVLVMDYNQDVIHVIALGQGKSPIPWHAEPHLEELTFLKVYGGQELKSSNTNLSYAERVKSENRRHGRRSCEPTKIFYMAKKN